MGSMCGVGFRFEGNIVNIEVGGTVIGRGLETASPSYLLSIWMHSEFPQADNRLPCKLRQWSPQACESQMVSLNIILNEPQRCTVNVLRHSTTIQQIDS